MLTNAIMYASLWSCPMIHDLEIEWLNSHCFKPTHDFFLDNV